MNTRLMKFRVTKAGVSVEKWLTPEEAEQIASQCRHPTRAYDSIVPLASDPLILEDE